MSDAAGGNEWFLGSLLIGVIASMIGHFLGGRNKVAIDTCLERRGSCALLQKTVIDNIHKEIRAINDKLDNLIDKEIM